MDEKTSNGPKIIETHECGYCHGTGDYEVEKDWWETCPRCFGKKVEHVYARTCQHCKKERHPDDFRDVYDAYDIYAGKACKSCHGRVQAQKSEYRYAEHMSESF